MSGVKRAHSTYNDVLEIWRAAEGEVGASVLVCRLLVALLACAAREEEPALQGVAPRCRLVDEIPCGESQRNTVKKREGNGTIIRETRFTSSPGGSIPAAVLRDLYLGTQFSCWTSPLKPTTFTHSGLLLTNSPSVVVHSFPRPPTYSCLSFTASHSALNPIRRKHTST